MAAGGQAMTATPLAAQTPGTKPHQTPPPRGGVLATSPPVMRRAALSPAIRVAAAAVLTSVAALGFHRLLPYGPLIAAAVAGVLAAVAASALLTGWRALSMPFALAGTAALWIVGACAAIGATVPGSGYGPAPTPSAVRQLLPAVREGWWRALTSVPPLGADPKVLAAVSAASALTASLAIEAALRSRAVLLVALPPFALLMLALLGGGPGSDSAIAAAFTALTAAFAAASAAREGPRRNRARRYAAAIPAAAVIGTLALGAANLPMVSSRAPFDPRSLVSPPISPRAAVNPLDQVSGWLAAPTTSLFTVSTNAVSATAPAELRLAVLDHFDGREWTSTESYTATSSRIPAPTPHLTVATTPVEQQVTLHDLATIWLPAASRPTTVSAPGATLAVDAEGELLIPAGTRAGLAYTVTSAVPQYTEAELRAATPVPDKTALALPGTVPAVIAATAQKAAAGAAFPYQQAARLADYLRAHATYDPTNPAGHTYGHIAYFLGTSHRGSSEQFAAAFALMARSLGLPTRLAVGFTVPAAPAGSAEPITGRNTLVWPEVEFSGLGWVPFYPTPSTGPSASGAVRPATGESAARQRADKTLTSATLPAPAPPTPAQHARATQRASKSATATGPAWWVWAGTSAAVALAAYLVAALSIPAVRCRRRRRATEPVSAILGAWAETVRQLRVLGLSPGSSATTAQICRSASGLLPEEGGRALSAVAAYADQAAYAAYAPPSALALAAWSGYDTVRRCVHASVPAPVRARHALLGRGLRKA